MRPLLRSMMKRTIHKTERLKSKIAINKLFKEGRSFAAFPYRVTYFLHDAEKEGSIQVGFSASARKFKKAVDRNRIKRLTREAYRLQQEDLVKVLTEQHKKLELFFIYTGTELPDFETAKAKTAVILKKIINQINEKNTADT